MFYARLWKPENAKDDMIMCIYDLLTAGGIIVLQYVMNNRDLVLRL